MAAIKYEVFISHRGPDAKLSFADSLNQELKRQHVHSLTRKSCNQDKESPVNYSGHRGMPISMSLFSLPSLQNQHGATQKFLRLSKPWRCSRIAKSFILSFMESTLRHGYRDSFAALTAKGRATEEEVQEWIAAFTTVSMISGHVVDLNELSSIIQSFLRLTCCLVCRQTSATTAKIAKDIFEFLLNASGGEDDDPSENGVNVLLVLDDVESHAYLLKLLPPLGRSSRVIVTSQDRDTLRSLTFIHAVGQLKHEDARMLFEQHAKPDAGLDRSLVEEIVGECKGVPLVLEMAGLMLQGSATGEAPRAKVSRASVCWIWEAMEDVEESMMNHDIKVLLDKHLLRLESLKLMPYHDLIRDMAHEEVNRESQSIGERSRMWNYKDADKLLTRSMRRDSAVNIDGGFKQMPYLNYLSWRGMTLDSSLRHSSPASKTNISFLDLSGSNINRLWDDHDEHKVVMDKLVELVLDKCKSLTTIKHVELSKISDLTELSPDFGKLVSLEELILKNCKEFSMLPQGFENLKNLLKLDLEGCALVQLPHAFGGLGSLKRLNIAYSRIQAVPLSISYLDKTEQLRLDHCFLLTKALANANHCNVFISVVAKFTSPPVIWRLTPGCKNQLAVPVHLNNSEAIEPLVPMQDVILLEETVSGFKPVQAIVIQLVAHDQGWSDYEHLHGRYTGNSYFEIRVSRGGIYTYTIVFSRHSDGHDLCLFRNNLPGTAAGLFSHDPQFMAELKWQHWRYTVADWLPCWFELRKLAPLDLAHTEFTFLLWENKQVVVEKVVNEQEEESVSFPRYRHVEVSSAEFRQFFNSCATVRNSRAHPWLDLDRQGALPTHGWSQQLIRLKLLAKGPICVSGIWLQLNMERDECFQAQEWPKRWHKRDQRPFFRLAYRSHLYSGCKLGGRRHFKKGDANAHLLEQNGGWHIFYSIGFNLSTKKKVL
ncbi:hypothetical protein SELMODRAFT_429055 [Selaginella moellendorffii]|uniref:Uncharacterized protein n=1 Tax=Selaginella moellendorffii TaxID=88036 RepID=D8T4X2_SELML|nr:hypothetical protein SELMODRAFT_429055 [Selaginella moellendorffii]